jgi:tRNA threonylcarbamoyladenosine biosynthesis protein TsaB
MLVLSIRTDKPESEIGLFSDGDQLAYLTWHAHRELAETIHGRIAELTRSIGKDWEDIGGIVCFKGPGSFTGLRIGIAVGNAMAYGLGVPVVSVKDEDWIQKGITRLQNKENESIAMPEYGSPVHITLPRT